MSLLDPSPKKHAPPTPGWLRVGMILFMLYVLSVAYRGYRSDSPEDAALKVENYPLLNQAITLDYWQQAINPGLGTELRVAEINAGEGDGAACGQRVVLAVRQPTAEESPQPIPAEMLPEAPLEFTLGDGTVRVLWDRGARGMRRGEVRFLNASSLWLEGDERELRYDAVLELQALTPFLAEGAPQQQQVNLREGMGVPISCGDAIGLHFRLLDAQGEVVYQLPEIVPYRVGSGVYGHGIDRGLIGLQKHGLRRLQIPPAYHAGARDDVPFPSEQIAIVEILPVAYKESQTVTDEKEPADVSDR